MKSNKLVLVVVMLIIVAIIVSIGATLKESEEQSTTKEWYEDLSGIYIGTGKIDEYKNVNSIDAIKTNYEKGVKGFEIDLSLTSDSKVVLRKDWTTFAGQENLNINTEGTNIPTLEQFKSDKIYGKYTPTSLEDIIDLMDQYKDMYIVVNISNKGQKDIVTMYTEIVDEFKAAGKTKYLDRMIVELYNTAMLDDIESVCHFRNYIYRIYKEDVNNLDSIIDFCNKKAIKTVSVDWYLMETVEKIQDKFAENNLNNYVYNVDDKLSAQKYIKNGAKGIFTNSLETQDIISTDNQGEENENKE